MEEVDFSKYSERPNVMEGFQYLGSGYEFVENEHGDLELPEYYVTYGGCYLWGGYSVPKSIHNIIITDPEVTVYNLTINSSAEEFRTVMESQGFEVRQHNNRLIATKEFFRIYLIINEELLLDTSSYYK